MTPLRYTRQELADALQAWVAQSETGEIHIYPDKPAQRWENGEMRRIPVSSFHIVRDPSILVVTDWPDDWRESLTPPRTEAEPEVCEWRAKGPGYETSCGYGVSKAAVVPNVCVCSRPIRIVEEP